MAHEITETDKFGEVRSTGKKAWHGLGMEIEDGLCVEDAFHTIGLGWETELAPLFARVDEIDPHTGESVSKYLPVTERCAQLRSDNYDVLGVVSPTYGPIPNMELARFCDNLTGADAAVRCETAGSLRGGKRIFALCKLPKTIEVVSGDILEQYIAVTNGHGGNAPFSVYPTSIRIVCANTLRYSERDMGKGVSFQHRGDMRDKLKQARDVLGLAVAETAEFERQVKALAGLQWSKAQIKAYMNDLYEEIFGAIDPTSKGAATRITNRNKLVNHWLLNLDDPRQGYAPGSAWAAFNAFTQWSEHERGRYRAVEDSSGRVHSNLFGNSADAKRKAFTLALTRV